MWGKGRGKGEPKQAPEASSDDEANELVLPPGILGTTISGLSKLAGVDRGTVQSWTRKEGFPEPYQDKTYNAFAVGVWYRDWKAAKQIPPTIGKDELLSGAGGDSPALEILRMQNAILAGYEVEEKRQTMIPRDKVLTWLMEFALQLREGFETIKRDFGDKAHLILEDTLRTALILVEEQFGSGNGPPSTDDPEATAVQ